MFPTPLSRPTYDLRLLSIDLSLPVQRTQDARRCHGRIRFVHDRTMTPPRCTADARFGRVDDEAGGAMRAEAVRVSCAAARWRAARARRRGDEHCGDVTGRSTRHR